MVAIPPDGVWCPASTFFKPATKDTIQPAVDVETQVAHIVHLAKNGIIGLVLLGSTGEAVALSKKERFDLVSGVRKGLDQAGFEGYPMIAGVLTNSVEEALDWCEDYKKAGAQWALVLAPGYWGAAVTQKNIVDWYTTVADRSPIPILIYNFPMVTNGITPSPDTYEKLAAHPNIVGCKMSHGNVSHHVQVSLNPRIDSKNFRVFTGMGQQTGPVCLFGAAGAIDGLTVIYPKIVVKLYKLISQRPITDESLREMQELQYKVSAAEEFLGATGVVGVHEAVYKVLGFGNLEGGRLPLRGELPEGAYEKWTTGNGALKAVAEIEATL